MPLRKHERDLAKVGDVLRRIAVNQHEIGQLARHDAAAVATCAGVLCAVSGRHLYRLRRRQAGLHVERELGLQGEARGLIRTRYERYVGSIQASDELDHFLVRALVARLGSASAMSTDPTEKLRRTSGGMWSAMAA